jgi:hypothetical protein
MPHCVACANLLGQLWFHPFFTKRRLHPSEQFGGASSPPDAFATYDIRAAALPGNPYDGHTLGTVIPHASAHRQRARSLHHRCRLSPPQRLPDHKFKVYTTGPEVPRNAADQARVQTADAIEPAPSRERHRMCRNHLANAVLAAAGYNFRRLPAWIDVFRSRSAPLP